MNDQDLLTLVMEGSPETFSGEELLALHQGVKRSAMLRRALQERLLLEECLVRALTVPPVLPAANPANNSADPSGPAHGSSASPTISTPAIPATTPKLATTGIPTTGPVAATGLGQAATAWPIWVKWGLGILFTTAGLSVPLLVVLLLGRGLQPEPARHSLPASPAVEEPATEVQPEPSEPTPEQVEPVQAEPVPIRGEAQDVGRVVRPLARDKHAAEIFSFDDEGSPSDRLPPSQR